MLTESLVRRHHAEAVKTPCSECSPLTKHLCLLLCAFPFTYRGSFHHCFRCNELVCGLIYLVITTCGYYLLIIRDPLGNLDRYIPLVVITVFFPVTVRTAPHIVQQLPGFFLQIIYIVYWHQIALIAPPPDMLREGAVSKNLRACDNWSTWSSYRPPGKELTSSMKSYTHC